jgi:hypothetical protein
MTGSLPDESDVHSRLKELVERMVLVFRELYLRGRFCGRNHAPRPDLYSDGFRCRAGCAAMWDFSWAVG